MADEHFECFVFKNSYERLTGKTSTVLSLKRRGDFSLRLFSEDDKSGRMIKIEINEVKNE